MNRTPGAGFPLRTVHLDFHTGPAVPDVGTDFEPRAFADRFRDAHVDSVTVFAKCHHGHLYYATDRPERHPSLPHDLDLLREQIDALHDVGIRAPIYLSVQWDEYAANEHPEWLALNEHRQQVRGGGGFEAHWQTLDMSSPYQDYLADQLDEVLRRFAPVDGVFLDICFDQPSCSKWAIDGMERAGMDPRDADQRARYARRVAHDYMERYRRMVEAAIPDDAAAGVWFNSRPKTNLHEEQRFLRHVEIEALPTGGWGYAYLPYVARFVRPLGLPTLAHTGRFHESWGDSGALKPQAALRYETAQILSLGLTNGIGDSLHPRGMPDPTVYEHIGDAYRHVQRCEPYVVGGEHLAEVAVVVDPELGDDPGPAGLGAVRALQQLRLQFDIVPPVADLRPYRLVVLPETTRISPSLREALQQFLTDEGALLVSGPAALDDNGEPALQELGMESHGPSPYTHVFLRLTDELEGATPTFDTVVYERGFRMTPTSTATPLVGIVEPYFERSYDRFSGHDYTPAGKLSPYTAILQNGRAVTCAVPLLESFGKHANVAYREVLGACIKRLLPDPLVEAGAPVHLETTVVRKGDDTIVHMLSFLPSRQAEGLDLVHDAFPLVDVPVSVRVGTRPDHVRLEPGSVPLEWTYADGYARTRVTVLDGHAMLVVS